MKINANEHGFSTENPGTLNSQIMNRLLSEYNDVTVTQGGNYAVDGTILIGSNSTLTFADGVYLCREKKGAHAGYVIANKGAYTRTYDENITITGLNIKCGGVECSAPSKDFDRTIPGLRGHLSFFYVKNLTVKNFTALDLPEKDFGIHVCTFQNLLIENVHIEGKKDAVHLGRGQNFVIRNGIFKTFDDPIALNAHDYASSNPQLGWIENGLIENCRDCNDTDTTGYFCRILAGSWCHWQKGMEIQNSDTVICGGRLYRALMAPDGKVYTSLTPPSHPCGMEIYDGINWVMVQEEVCENCGCRNIRFKDIFIEKNRPVAFSIHFDNDRFSRSVYPSSNAPIQENISFENVQISGNVPVFLYAVTALRGFKITNSRLNGATVEMSELEQVESYPCADFEFSGTELPGVSKTPKRTVKIEY